MGCVMLCCAVLYCTVLCCSTLLCLCTAPLLRHARMCDRSLAVIEKYTANTRFCMICNYVNKITPALQSRCTR
jgi:hypothetical protein